MQLKVQKWDDSLAFRIPQVCAATLGLMKNSDIEVQLTEGKLIITPALMTDQPTSETLDDLIAQLTSDTMLHSEIDTGFPVGNEAW